MNSSLDIIIVNWNAGRQLYECISSIKNTSKEGFQLNNVIVVDNASQDDSLKGLSNLGVNLKVIKNKTNRGFGAACNQGASESKADYLLFLNPDTMLFESSLSKPIKFMDKTENREIGICGIQLIDEYNKIATTCSRFPKTKYFISKMFLLNKIFPSLNHHMIEWDHKNNLIVDQVMGAFLLIRNKVFKELKGFDKRFFVYFEEVDLSYRALKMGYKCYYFAESAAFHKGCGTSEQVKAKRLFYSIRSRILYGFKHFTLPSALTLLIASLLFEPISRISLGIIKRSIEDIKEVFKAYRLLYKNIPNIMRLSK